MSSWVIVLTFFFAGHQGTKVEIFHCDDVACVSALEHTAYQDTAVGRIQVWPPGWFAPLGTGAYVWPALKDVWRQ